MIRKMALRELDFAHFTICDGSIDNLTHYGSMAYEFLTFITYTGNNDV